ncbi:MAG: PAS domain S-box protein, partial [Alphaproteobacteria bacterium]|nr:PAS domain S-box protein [Alphaproteobacteria bacterium]
MRLSRNLSFRQARDAVIIAFVVGLAFSLWQIFADLQDERDAVERTVNQVLKTLNAPAVLAAYTVDENLANDVVHSVFEYRPIYSAVLVDDFGDTLAELRRPASAEGLSILADAVLEGRDKYSLPLVNESTGQSLGELRVQVDGALIVDNFLRRSTLTIVFGFIRTLILAVLLTYVFYLTLTKPLTALSRRIAGSDPLGGGIEPEPLEPSHKDDELGQLAASVNSFMTAAKTQLEDRLKAEDALRDSEQRFRSTFEQAAVGIAHVGVDGGWLLVNQRLCDILGYEQDELLALPAEDMTLAEERVESARHFERLLRGESQTYTAERRYVRKDGSLVWVNLTSSLVRDTEGEPSYFVLVIEDIEKRKEDEARRQELEASLRQAQKMEAVGQLTGGVAHDFNNLMTVVIGNAELLESVIGDDEKSIRAIAAIKRAVDRGSSLTHRLLAFSRQQPLSPIAADIPGLIGGLEDMLRRTLGETVDLRVVQGTGCWPAMIDPHQFEDALLNLAINSRDAMPTGGLLVIETGNITLDAAYAEKNQEVAPGDYVEIAVSDDGTGIAAEALDKVFEPFFSTKDVGKGSGLGLSMVYGFAKQSRGHVTIYSEAGHGTTVKLYLPRADETGMADEAGDEMRRLDRGSERILVVEDDPAVREIPVLILRDHGYDVVEVTDGAQAIDCLKDGERF